MNTDAAFEQSRTLYERAIRAGDHDALTQARRLLDQVTASLALASGRVMHGEFLLERTRDSGQASENPEELLSFERGRALPGPR